MTTYYIRPIIIGINIELIREERKNQGLSQQELARAANISLATLQNIESARANPSVETLEKILRQLGLAFTLTPQPYQWDALAFLGAPLMTRQKNLRLPLSEDRLLKEIRFAVRDLQYRPHGRRKIALKALLVALRDHYPSIYRKLKSPRATSLTPQGRIDGSLIKLRRLALARLGEYL